MQASNLVELLSFYGLRFIFAVILFFVGWFLIKFIVKMADKGLERRFEPTLTRFTVASLKVVLIILLVITAASTVGIEMTSFIAILGAAGFAVGFALQGSLANFAGGVLLLIFHPFRVGDFIDTGNHMGKVIEIQLLYTIMNTRDNKRVYIPNGSLANNSITNFSSNEERRVDLVFGIGYDDDFEEAKDIIKDIIAGNDKILLDPEPVVRVGEHADSSVNIFTRVWVKSKDVINVNFDLHEDVKRRFDEAGIGIPYPQMDIHFDPQVSDGFASRKEQLMLNKKLAKEKKAEVKPEVDTEKE